MKSNLGSVDSPPELMPAPNPPLGDELRELRESRGWTQKKLAQWVGVHATAVSAWENNLQDPIEEHAVILVGLFDESDRDLSTTERRKQER